MRGQLWFVVLGTVVASGCGQEMGPEPRETTRVSGMIVDAGQPVQGGWVEFVPVDGTVGNLRSAPIGTDGRFEATGVAVGRNLVGLAGPLPQILRPRYVDSHNRPVRFDSFSSPIRRSIAPGHSTKVVIDLAAEARRAADASASLPDRSAETRP